MIEAVVRSKGVRSIAKEVGFFSNRQRAFIYGQQRGEELRVADRLRRNDALIDSRSMASTKSQVWRFELY